MQLKTTYEAAGIHEHWQAVYRRHPLREKLNRQIMDRVLAQVQPSPDALILDAGCGSGTHTIEFARRGYRCVGVDISEYILSMARDRLAEAGLASRAEFVCGGLDTLSLADCMFDVVYCRGVLMHIPRWEEALANLCRVLKPGGRLAILESNHLAVETMLVRGLRRFRKVASKLVHTPGGLEFWGEQEGQPVLVRATNIGYLTERLRSHGVETTARFATEFWDINRFPARLRGPVTQFNRLCMAIRTPWFLSHALAVIGVKTGGGAVRAAA